MFKAVDGHLFIKKQVVVTAFAQKVFGIVALESMHLTFSSMVPLNLSARPFCWGVLATNLCLAIPIFLQ